MSALPSAAPTALPSAPRTRIGPSARRRVGGLVAAAFALSTIGAFVAPAAVFGWGPSSFSSADESELITLTNQARAGAGLSALVVDSTLTSIARWRSEDMAVRDYFSHQIPSPPGGMVFAEMDRRGYCYSLAGENIGWNTYPDNVATQQIQSMFLASPDHRANIMGAAWNRIGVGAYEDASGKKLWTVLFADACSAAPKPTPTPTPKATPKPTPKPTAAPVVTPPATQRPTAPPAATAVPTATSTPTATPSPTPTLSPTESPSAAPSPTQSPSAAPSANSSESPATAASAPAGALAPSGTLQIQESPPAQGLVDTLVGGVAGFFFGG